MGFIYSFVDLGPVESGKRRQLLDYYGQLAQISALVPIIFIYVQYVLRIIANRYYSPGFRGSTKARQSPTVSRHRPPASVNPWIIRWRRLNWFLDDEILKGRTGWGTRRVWLLSGVWMLWLLILTVRDTGDDYLHLTKRFGIVAASQLPLHYLLAAKSWSPLHYLLRMSHEELNPYHRLLGRIIIVLFSAHAALYTNFYIQSKLFYRFRSQTVILGLTAISTFILIGTSSLQWVRNKSYLLFFVIHVVLSIFILPILWFHVSHLRMYIAEAAAAYVILIIQRKFSQKLTLANLSLVPASGKAHGLITVSFPLPRNELRKYKPGQHIYLSIPPNTLTKPWETLRFNPFTVASSSAITKNIGMFAADATQPVTGNAKTHTSRLMIRPLRSSTAMLATLAEKWKAQPVPMIIEGPYGSASYFPDFASTSFSRILLVAGGVGASFTLPIYQDLIARRNGQDVRFVWSVRRKEEAISGLDVLREGNEELEGVKVYLTSPGASQIDGTSTPSLEAGGAKAGNEDIELEERAGLLETTEDAGKLDDDSFEFKHGRPNTRAIVDDFFHEDEDEGKVAVLVCGPASMGKALREEVGHWVRKGRDVFWHAEQFGW